MTFTPLNDNTYAITNTPYLLIRREVRIAPTYYKVTWVALNPAVPNSVRMVFPTMADAEDFWSRQKDAA